MKPAISNGLMRNSFRFEEKSGIKGERGGLERGGLVPVNDEVLR